MTTWAPFGQRSDRPYRQGLFGAGGRQPLLRQHGNWISPDRHGRTIEVGSRENGKRLCVYEKGMQLGAPWHPLTRWELSLGNKDRDIP
jgi:phage replication initiation protein